MAKKIHLISVLFFLILFNSVFGLPVSSCSQTLSSNGTLYELTGNISSSSGCLTISENNIVLDCQNHSITHSTGTRGS
ncbi:MAG: hypothetical protein COT90_00715 [Candidatus Diapherotrites archaeon CG10_big_fil_rev_8_21_14_0_10_31_34]|nr:MAG: hypothetical protein COT90_00715 [Candidatus Diapherotrites archaeon CG10_big_fil_rev_8_21_14_0_10_31_34]